MNREQIIRMAREAGFEIERVVAVYPDGSRTVIVAPMKELARFAALVSAHERESLANILEHQCKIMSDYHDVKWLSELARAIRKRGER